MSWRDELQAFIRREALPIEKYGHQPRLYALTQEIGASLIYEDDVVFAAAWLHDLGVFTGHRPEDPAALAVWDNTSYAIEQAPAILTRIGFPAEKIDAVLEAIRTHQPHAKPQSMEATILRDADILEQLGAVGILRTVCKVGRDTRFATFTQALTSLRRSVETLPAQLRLEKSKRLAAPRVELLLAFLAAAEREAGGDLH